MIALVGAPFRAFLNAPGEFDALVVASIVLAAPVDTSDLGVCRLGANFLELATDAHANYVIISCIKSKHFTTEM